MYRETYGADHVAELVSALKHAETSLEWFIKNYPKDREITAHKIHLRRVKKALEGW